VYRILTNLNNTRQLLRDMYQHNLRRLQFKETNQNSAIFMGNENNQNSAIFIGNVDNVMLCTFPKRNA